MKILRNASVSYVAVTLLKPAVTFSSLPLLTAVLSQSEFGQVFLLMPLIWLSQAVFTIGINEIIVRVAALREDYFSLALGASTVSVFGGILLYTLLDTLSGTLVGFQDQWMFLGVALTSSAQSIVAVLAGALRGAERVQTAVTLLAVNCILPTVSAIAGIFLSPDCKPGAFWLGMGTGTVSCALFGLATTKPEAYSLGYMKIVKITLEGARRGLPLVPQFSQVFVIDFIVRRVTSAYWGAEIVAVLAIAASFAGLSLAAIKAVMNAWVPRFYRAESNEESSFMLDSVPAFVCLATLVVLCSTFFAQIAAFLGLLGQYEYTGLTTGVLLAGVASMFLVPVTALTFVAIKRERTSVLAWSSPLAAVLALGTIVVPGIRVSWLWGLATGSAVSLLSYCLLLAVLKSQLVALSTVKGFIYAIIWSIVLVCGCLAVNYSAPDLVIIYLLGVLAIFVIVQRRTILGIKRVIS